ncbi:PstS family phosphate ABC transporter substrate-binding protein [Salinimicrobium tongyeongense]|uniref:Phosphate-binding protein n=1 Tax=Salinimicrobium tongyeongense TaxID=2809707 RepID=A0ABY6NT57_9FLAO|nr:PstS family phosphate ABC transporter substrate-binding protein [Salinimicrobium tongyeongense]UZH55663.1 PstS family phosphate ABC transporter substrate-binding protein [Salinimicrobium tongyeongense]
MKRFLLLTAISISLVSCGNNKKEGSKNAISIDGSSTVYPVTEAIAEEYRAEAPDVDVTIGVSGTGGGFQKFGRGEVAITNASRPIKADEKAIAESNNISYVELEVAYDGLAVVVHPENDWVSCFTVEQLKKIWEPAAQGTITRWNQIDPSWPDEEIHLFGPGVASGTFDYFTEAIVGKSGSSRGDYTASEDDNVLVQGVSGDKYGLGFFGLAYYEENSDKLKMVPVDGGEGCVEPSTESVSNGTYAPLSRPLYIYVNSASLENPAVIDFVEFYLDEAPQLLQDVGYIPLTSEEYNREKEKFAAFVKENSAE